MNNIKLIIAYDGSEYHGWQKTASGPSVEESLQTVLEQILQVPVTLQAASRTDRGVHAEKQVVNFHTGKTPPSLISLNKLLPSSITALEMEMMPPEFHPTLDAKGKLYTYCICMGPTQLPFYRHFSWHVHFPLNAEEMKKAAYYFIGEHDFSAFCNQRRHLSYPHKRRVIESIEFYLLDNKRLQIALRGNHFLYKMVRNIVGTLVYVGQGKLTVDEIPMIIASKKRVEAGITAPAHGLTLKEIYY